MYCVYVYRIYLLEVVAYFWEEIPIALFVKKLKRD